MSVEIGDRIGPYEIREPLGEGGMAAVYKAWHTGLHRFEALKIPRANGSSHDGAFVQRLLTEARTAASLHHPHIVAIHNVSEPTAPLPFFAMDFVAGSDLSKVLAERGHFSLAETVEILEPVASALDYAHNAGIIHRDIKPANILLGQREDGSWNAKVVDFGISRAAEDDDIGATKLTKSGMIVGTPEYMSPEQSGSGEPVERRTDLYSLGVVAYEMVCGRPPFTAGDGVSRLSILISHVRDDPRALAGNCKGVSQAANTAILKALQKQPDDRFPTCSAFAKALREALDAPAMPVSPENTPFDGGRFLPLDGATMAEIPPPKAGTLAPQPLGQKTALLEPATIVAPVLAPVSAPMDSPEVAPKTRRTSRTPLWAALGGILAGGLFVFAVFGRDNSLAPSLPANSIAKPKIAADPVAVKREIAAPRTAKIKTVQPMIFPVQTRRSDQKPAGTRFVQQKGRNGAREVIIAVTFQGAKELSRRVESWRILKAPRPQIEVLGTQTAAPTPQPVVSKSVAPRTFPPRISSPRRVKFVKRPLALRVAKSDDQRPAPRPVFKPVKKSVRKPGQKALARRPAKRYFYEAPLPP